MRKILSTLTLMLALVVAMSSCQKGEVVQDVNSLGTGSYVTLTKAGNLNVDATNLASTVSIEVAEYGSTQEKIIMYVTKGNTSLNRATWKKIKEVPINGGNYTLVVSGNEIKTAVGANPAPGDQFTIYNQIVTKDGRTFDVVNTGADFAGLPAYNMALTWKATVVCPFDAAAAAGKYEITFDNWDFAIGETVDVTATANTATLTYAFPYSEADSKPLVLKITPSSGAAVVDKQVYGSYPSYGITNISANGSGFFFSCNGQITLSLTHTVPAGSYGTYSLRMKKVS